MAVVQNRLFPNAVKANNTLTTASLRNKGEQAEIIGSIGINNGWGGPPSAYSMLVNFLQRRKRRRLMPCNGSLAIECHFLENGSKPLEGSITEIQSMFPNQCTENEH